MNFFPDPEPPSNSDIGDANRQLVALGLSRSQRVPAGWLDSRCRERFVRRFAKLHSGTIAFHDGKGDYVLGSQASTKLSATVEIYHSRFYRQTLFGGTIGAAEAYMDGQWSVDDLTALIRIIIRNLGQFSKLDRTWSRLMTSWHRLLHLLRRNTIDGSRRNISQHYDLGNDFYQLFLDPTMNYSSGIFPTGAQTMHDSSLHKMRWICEKLQLKPGDQVLEIGTGWGGLATFMAKHYGCHVTTTTISSEQHKFAKQRVIEAGLEEKVETLLVDYRNLTGKYEKLVSVEMIEAVGHEYFDQYFGKCSDLLADDGLMLLQGITMGEQNYRDHIKNVDFIRRYIFPGGCLPSVTAIGQSLGRATDMRMVHLEDITQHYETTLQKWRERFFSRIGEVRELGYDDRFIRMWHFYLCYCEAAFAERRVNTVQVVLAKPLSDVDPANDYSAAPGFSSQNGSLGDVEPKKRESVLEIL